MGEYCHNFGYFTQKHRTHPPTGLDYIKIELPYTNVESMQIFLSEFSKQISAGRQVALVIDNAGWHTARELIIPKNITLIPLPPYSPELNAMEQVWEWVKLNHLSNCNFQNYDEIVDKVCFAWNQFSQQPSLVTSLCSRDWLVTP